MNNNTTISLDAIVMIHKIKNRYSLFKNLFSDIGVNAKDFIPISKFLLATN